MRRSCMSIILASLVAAVLGCNSGGGAVAFASAPQKPVKSFLVVNPVLVGSQHQIIHNLTRRVTARQISEELLAAFPGYKRILAAKFKPYGNSNVVSNKYAYADIFGSNDKPIVAKMKKLIHDPDKLLVVPVIKVFEKREDIDVDTKFICPNQYRARLQLSYRYIDSRGKLLLDSSQIEREDAAVQYELHELRRTSRKCGMVYRVNQNYKTMFQRSNVDYLKEVMQPEPAS